MLISNKKICRLKYLNIFALRLFQFQFHLEIEKHNAYLLNFKKQKTMTNETLKIYRANVAEW